MNPIVGPPSHFASRMHWACGKYIENTADVAEMRVKENFVNEPLMTLEQVARILNVDLCTAQVMASQGAYPVIRIYPFEYRVDRTRFEAWINGGGLTHKQAKAIFKRETEQQEACQKYESET